MLLLRDADDKSPVDIEDDDALPLPPIPDPDIIGCIGGCIEIPAANNCAFIFA